MELMGVSEGLERLKDVERVQINTDSRFVIRGLVQWVHFWRYNDWQTAYGRSVKFREQWQRIDALCSDKLIQFKWIKGHSGHEMQDYCHRLAQQAGQSADLNNRNNADQLETACRKYDFQLFGTGKYVVTGLGTEKIVHQGQELPIDILRRSQRVPERVPQGRESLL